MKIFKEQSLRTKAVMLSIDGGKTWVVSKCLYLADSETGRLFDEKLDGLILEQRMESEDDKRQLSRS